MSRKRSRVMVVDDELGVRESLRMLLEDDYEVSAYPDAFSALEAMDKDRPDLILLDITMPGMNGIDFLKKLRDAGRDLPVAMLTATKTIRMAVQCMKLGASDYITKPYAIEEILDVVASSLREHQEHQARFPRAGANGGFDAVCCEEAPHKIIGRETTLAAVFQLVSRIANTDSTVLITGESGTGKEVVARAIHNESSRRKKPFLAVHLSATPEKLIESELFGHVKGSFTGADKDHAGFLEAADGGTVFLDEIGDIPLAVQAKLLRAIQEKEYRKVGSNTPVKVNVRFISATNKDLMTEVREKRFREDLYYRLNVIPIHMPPLRERKRDIPGFVSAFSEVICRKLQSSPVDFTPEVMDVFDCYPWPGNVRELQNTVEHMILMNDGPVVGSDLIPLTVRDYFEQSGSEPMLSSEDAVLDDSINRMEKDLIVSALRQSRGFITDAAEKLGTTRRILKYKMDKLGIDRSEYRKAVHA